MPTRAGRMPVVQGREVVLAGAATGFTLITGFLATGKWGLAGLLVPLVLIGVLIMMFRPLLLVSLVVAVVILFEKATFGLFTFTDSFYGSVVKDLTVVDALVGLSVVAVALDMIRHRRPLRIPGPLKLPMTLLALAMLAGAVTGHAAGASIHLAIFSEDTLAYLLFLPIAIANLDITREQLKALVTGLLVLAILKAALGMIELASGRGLAIEGIGGITYYEAAANWVVMMGMLAVFAAVVMRVKVPVWCLAGGVVMFASLLLSYRRSFWIAAVLGLALIVMLGLRPSGRRVLVPVVLAMIAAVWLMSSVSLQSQNPIVKRATSLAPSSLSANADDRYRIDERANVWGEIVTHPITGLGVTIPWQAIVQPLPVEGVGGGREYVHFAALWFWLKLGVLGVLAYVSILIGTAILAWRAWRLSSEPMLRVFGLASLCAVAGLAVLDTTASFTGVDPRFTVIVAAQIGLLAQAVWLTGGSGALPAAAPALEKRAARGPAR